MAEENQVAENTEQTPVEFQIQRIYIKDVSFEAPNLPTIFHQEWKPQLGFELDTETVQVDEDLYEVALHMTVSTTLEDSGDTAFICEVKQAGVFTIKGLEGIQLQHALASQCPTILFPYARELISNLSPVNFDALFVDYLERQAAAEQSDETAVN